MRDTRTLRYGVGRYSAAYEFTVVATGIIAKFSRRERMRVFCEKCSTVVHEATVDPEVWARSHYHHEHLYAVKKDRDG